jgi:PhzF family phenazine biosynthesis protein
VGIVLRGFHQVDVFASRPYAGNPVAVVLDGAGISTEDMARFTNWSNLSECAFLLPASTGGADYRVRIFTPGSGTGARSGLASELPFAGHPTLGACHAWLAAGGAPRGDLIVQECPAGMVSIRRANGVLAFAAPPLMRSGPVDARTRTHIAEVLRISASDLVDAAWADNGPGWVAVLLTDAEAVLALQPGYVDLDLGVIGFYPPGSPAAYEIRTFFPKRGMTVEDPVTGSFNASAAQWLIRSGRVAPPYKARQGSALGRAGEIDVREEDGELWIGGATMTRIRGQVDL